MITRDTFSGAAGIAERIVREHNIPSLPVDPIRIANSVGIEVVAKPASDGGVSGMLIRYGEQFCIAYATHITSQGFKRFTIAHELGHYFLEGHVDAIFREGSVHESRAGFVSAITYAKRPIFRSTETRWRGVVGGGKLSGHLPYFAACHGDPLCRMRARAGRDHRQHRK
jgi:hypothetical protein